MVTGSVVGIQPSVLRWARESQGLSPEEVAHTLKRDLSEILAWEMGKSAPTYSQLEDLAYKIYKRPLALFFLPAPPSEPNLKHEFRTLPGSTLDNLSADTRYQLRVARSLQDSLHELNSGTNPANRKVFKEIHISLGENHLEVAARIRQFLGISLPVQVAWRSAEEALKSWRDVVEEAGVYVFKHAFKQKEISGFCLLDPEFPLIYLNNSTAKSRQIFSLFHELAHLLLNVNTISLLDDSFSGEFLANGKKLETFCNLLAAEILIPSEDFTARIGKVDRFDDDIIQKLAKHYHVSREVILRRALDWGLVDRSFYENRASQWRNEVITRRPGGGDYYATQASYLGEKYLRLVFSKHYQGSLTTEQVAEYLGIKTRYVAGLEELLYKRTIAA